MKLALVPLRDLAFAAFQALIAGVIIWAVPRVESYLFPEAAELRRAVMQDATVRQVVGPVEDVAMYRIATTQDEEGAIHERHIVTAQGEKGEGKFNVLATRDRESGKMAGKPVITRFGD